MTIAERTVDFPTGTWGDEVREYHVAIGVPPQHVGDKMAAARVSLVVDDQPVSQSLIEAIWTDDHAASTRLNQRVAHYTGQAELADAIADGLDPRAKGDTATATVRFGRAAQLAEASGNSATLRLLKGVVEIEDTPTGTVRLRRKAERGGRDGTRCQVDPYCQNRKRLMTTGPTHRSARTEQLPSDDPSQRSACQGCGAARVDDPRFCETCGHDHTASVIWSVEVSADRAYYERTGSDIPFPNSRVPSVLVFKADEITVGRRSESRGIAPDVDLSGDLADPGVSHAHATIGRDSASRSLTIVDLGSTNGTTINADELPIEPNQPMLLNPGDRIHVGAWTTIEIRS